MYELKLQVLRKVAVCCTRLAVSYFSIFSCCKTFIDGHYHREKSKVKKGIAKLSYIR